MTTTYCGATGRLQRNGCGATPPVTTSRGGQDLVD